MDPVPIQTPAGEALPDIHFDPPQQHPHAVPTGIFILAGFLVTGAAVFAFMNRDALFMTTAVDTGTPPEEKIAAMAAVKAAAEAEGRPKLTREEKMQFIGVIENGEATSTSPMDASAAPTEGTAEETTP